jgi:uncharacterized protein (TIGR02001 family)
MKALNWITNRHVVSALIAAPILFSCAYASAEEAAPDAGTPPVADHLAREHVAASEPAPAYTLTYNLGLYSSYMFRGVNLSDGPALQGGIDWAHSSGFYLGTWFSNIDPYVNGDLNDGVTKGNHLETDWYGGYAHTFENGLGINLLGNYYYYPGSHKINGDRKENSFEASVALSYKWFTYTYYRVLTDYYGSLATDGANNTKGADYHELKVNYKLPVGDLNLMTKVGYQNTRHIVNTAAGGLGGSQGDFAIGLNRDFSLPGAGKPIEGFNAGAYYTTTFDVENEAYYKSADGRDTNEDNLWFYVKRTW